METYLSFALFTMIGCFIGYFMGERDERRSWHKKLEAERANGPAEEEAAT